MQEVKENLELLLVVAAILTGMILYYLSKKKSNAPLVGIEPGILGFIKTPYNWIRDPIALIKEGAEKYGNFGKTFRIATPRRDIIVASSQEVIQELCNLPTSIVSLRHAGEELFQTAYTFHDGILQDAYHIDVMRKNMTAKLSSLVPESVDEIKNAFEELTDIKNEWTNINVLDISSGVISRATSRTFVGLPLCRNTEYLDNITQFSINVAKTANIVDLLPWFFRRTAVRFLLRKNASEDILMKYLAREFETRKIIKSSLTESPISTISDAIQWILDATSLETPIMKLVQRLMFFNFASIHPTSITLAHTLYDIAANPEIHDSICTEIDEVLIAEGGWTKQGLTKMKKLDSVLRESSRMNGINVFSVIRKVLTPYTFIDGTHVQKGDWVCVALPIIHYLPEHYETPETFDGLRFYKMRQQEGKAHQYQMASPALDYLIFGAGKNSCPGRFFATNQLKIAVAYILYNYKLRLNGGVGGGKPPNFYSGISCIPNPAVGIEMKAREDRRKSATDYSHTVS
ncbi:cytochrome P450 [Tuber indicum]|nr:cytochrome P450 [Tuber indicum]